MGVNDLAGFQHLSKQKLRHKQIVYEDRMKQVCSDLEIDYDMVSKGILDNNDEYKKKRSDVVNDLCEKMCCKIYMITYVPMVNLIKG